MLSLFLRISYMKYDHVNHHITPLTLPLYLSTFPSQPHDLKKSPLRTVLAAHMFMDVKPSTGAWGFYQWPHPPERMLAPFSRNSQ